MYHEFWQDSNSSLSALCKFQMYITRIHMFNPLSIIIWYMFHYFIYQPMYKIRFQLLKGISYEKSLS